MKWFLGSMMFVACFLLTLPARAYDIGAIQKQIDDQGHAFTVSENWITRLDPSERARLGGALAPDNPPLAPDWSPKTPASDRDYLDWRDNYGNYVSQVRQQGSCGSCWAFAPVAMLESRKMIWLLSGTDPDYSEQYLLSCSSAGDCDYGYADQALDFLCATGTPPESCFPYEGDDTVACGESCPETADYINRMSNAGFVTLDYVDVDAIKSALDEGPVITWLRIHESLYAYDDGVYSAYGSAYSGSNHFVLVIGYDDAEQCWIAKNSWGMGWGEDGFFRIAYDSGCLFGHWTLAAEFSPTHAGPNWYVATDGEDIYNNGSREQPFNQIGIPCWMSSEGDSILVAPGEYPAQGVPLQQNWSFILAGQGEVGDVVLVAPYLVAALSESEVVNITFRGSLQLPSVMTFTSPTFSHCVFSVDHGSLVGAVTESFLSFHHCSFIGCGGPLFDLQESSVLLDACTIAFNDGPLVSCDGQSSVDMECSLMWGNAGGDYVDCFSGLEQVNDNLWDNPWLCDWEAGDLTLYDISPCLPENNVCNVLIGAHSQGCEYEVDAHQEPVPGGISLKAYPNPFNPEVTIVFELPTPSQVDCRVYDLAGRPVRALLDAVPRPAGPHEIRWDGRDEAGRACASGIYFVGLGASDGRLTRKVTLLK